MEWGIMRIKIYLSVWHSMLSTDDLLSYFPFNVVNRADIGDARGAGGAVYKESYCRFDLGFVEVELESEITKNIILLINNLEGLARLEGARKLWLTAQIPHGTYEISISPEEMKNLSKFEVGLSFDISDVALEKEESTLR